METDNRKAAETEKSCHLPTMYICAPEVPCIDVQMTQIALIIIVNLYFLWLTSFNCAACSGSLMQRGGNSYQHRTISRQPMDRIVTVARHNTSQATTLLRRQTDHCSCPLSSTSQAVRVRVIAKKVRTRGQNGDGSKASTTWSLVHSHSRSSCVLEFVWPAVNVSYTCTPKKRPPFYFSNNSVKN